MAEQTGNDNQNPDRILPPEANDLSRTRVNQLANVSESLQTGLPEFIGMTIYGSVSRGEARVDSDVDMFMFIEPTDDPSSPQGNPRLLDGEPKIKYQDDLPTTPVFHGAIELDYKALALAELDKNGISKSDIDVLPISKALVDEGINSFIKETELFERDSTHTFKVPRTIRGLFHPHIGSNARLQPYIEQVLNGLEERATPSTAELAWTTLRHMVIGFEKGRDATPDQFARQIPETLAGAQLLYAPTTLKK